MHKRIDAKLKLYSGLALGLLASNATGQVIYTDVAPDLVFTSNDKYNLDLNNDSKADFTIEAITKTSNLYGYEIRVNGIGIYAHGQNEILVDYFTTNQGGNSYWPKALGLNQQVDHLQQSWINTSSGLAMNIIFEFNFSTQTFTSTFQAGHWQKTNDKYLGLRLKLNGNWHYGWARLDVDSAGQQFIIKEYAYNGRPASPILTGEKGSSAIHEKEETDYFYLENKKIVFKKPVTDHQLTVYNLAGMKLKEEHIRTNTESKILYDLSPGIYFVEIRAKNSILVKKVLLN